MKISYDWVKSTPVAIIEENELPSWSDPQQLVEAVKAVGAQFVRYPAIRWAVHTFGKSCCLPKYPELGDRDLFGEVLSAMHAAGIKVMAYCHFGVVHCTAAEKHPGFLAREYDGTPIPWGGQPTHMRSCMCNDMFLESMYGAIDELCQNYRFEALYLDGPTWYGDCFCDFCKRAYFEKSGRVMPEKLSFSDGSQQILNQVRDDACCEILRRVREITPERLPLMFNMTLEFLPNHRTGVPELTNANAFGGNTTEIHRPGSFWETLMTLRLGEALDGVSLGYLPPGPYETLRNFAMAEIEVVNSAYLMHGATPMVCAVTTFINDTTNAALLSKEIAKHGAEREIYHEAEKVKNIALIYPRHSFELADESQHKLIERAFRGTHTALLQAHRHFDAFFDTQITPERLAGYRAVAIPGGTQLPEEKLKMVIDYVKNGGSLYVSGKFSAPEEFLGVRNIKDRPYEPCRGREYRETGPRYGYSLVPEAYFKMRKESLAAASPLLPVSDAVVGVPYMNRTLEYKISEALPGAEVLADLYLPAGGAFGKPLEFPYGTPPGIVLNSYGKGKVIWCATDIGLHYEARRLAESREVLAKLFDILAGEFFVKLHAPAGVVMNVTSSADGGQYYLHLLNYCGIMQECGCSVECIVDLHDITVEIPSGFSAVSLSDNKLLANDNGRVTIPTLGVFETLVLKKAE